MTVSKNKIEKLKKQALEGRRAIVKSSAKTGLGHIGSIFSELDILIALYAGILKVSSKQPNNPNRDRFILSKGHGALGLYYVLMLHGFISKQEFERYGENDTNLAGHPVYGSAPGIDATTGSLGHGLPIGLGLALSSKSDKKKWKTFVLMSDGECNEGSVWESVFLAGHLKLNNLVVVIDYNKIQSIGTTKEVLDMEPFGDKWRDAKWNVKEIDGHNFKEIITSASTLSKNKPTVIIAHTVKGKGLPFMENTVSSHYSPIKKDNLEEVLKEIY